MEQKLIYSQIRLKNLLNSSKQKLAVYLNTANEQNKLFFETTLKKVKLEDYNSFVNSLANDEDLDLYEGESDSFYELASQNVKMYDKFNHTSLENLNHNIRELKENVVLNLTIDLLIGVILFTITLLLGLVIY